MIPLFKSDYSLGRSILKITPSKDPMGADSIIDICLEKGLETMVLVEDNLTGFMTAVNEAKKAKIQLIFGLRISCVNDIKSDVENSEHKVVIFAKDDEGCLLLNKIYSQAHIDGGGNVDFSMLHSLWDDEHLLLAIPFYDSFLFNNTMKLGCCVPDFSKIKPIFFIEHNNLPFDSMIRGLVEDYVTDHEVVKVQSIFYKKKADYRALQTYKILCDRKMGKLQTLDMPELPHFGSDEFCWESYESKTA